MPVRKRLLPEPSSKKSSQSSSPSSSNPSEKEKVEPRLLTIPQTAQLLNTSIWSVRQMHKDKQLRRVRIRGKRIVFDRVDIDSLIEKLKAA